MSVRKLLTVTMFLIGAIVPALAQTVPLGPRFVLPYQTVIDPTGVPIPGALLNFYASGTNTRLTTYSDPLLTVPNANPLAANAAGVFPNIFLNGNYKIILTDSLANQIWMADPVDGLNGTTINVTPAQYGAKCDGITDDTAALQSMFTIIVANGGNATVSFQAGVNCLIYNSGQPVATPLAVLTSVSNIRILGNGATLTVGHSFLTSENLNIFQGNTLANFWVDGLNLTQAVPVTIGASSPYGTLLVSCANTCANISLTNSIVSGSEGPIVLSTTVGVFMENVQSLSSLYGFVAGDGVGNTTPGATRNVFIRNLYCSKCNRTFFLHGASQVDAAVTSINPRSNDVLITSDENGGINEAIALSYTLLPRTSGTAPSYITIGNSTVWNAVTSSIYRNIRVNVDMDLSGDTSLAPAIQFIKSTTSSLSNTYENINFGGRIANVPALSGKLVDLFTSGDASWSGETAANISLENLYVTGSATPAFYVDYAPFLTSTAGQFSLRNLTFPGNYTDANNSNVATQRIAINTAFANLMPVLNPTFGGSGLYQPTPHSIFQGEGVSAFGLITAATAGNIIIDQGSGSDWLSTILSQDCTLAASGAITCTKTNGTAFTGYATAAIGQLPGTATNDNASAGNIGEYAAAACPVNTTTATVTITIAVPGVISWASHPYLNANGRADACPVIFTTSGALPTGIVSGTVYWTIPSSIVAGVSFRIASSLANALAGTAITTSGTQSGTQTGTAGTPLTNNTVANITGVSLTAGDWDVWVNGYASPSASLSTSFYSTIATSASSLDQSPGKFGVFSDSAGTTTLLSVVAGPYRIRLASTTTEFFNAYALFGGGSASAWGIVQARRVR